jgi:hypothetical protein
MSDLVDKLIKLANKPGYTPMPASMLKAPVKKPKASNNQKNVYLSGLADPIPRETLDKINKVYGANPGAKGGIPELTGASLGVRF